MGTVGPLAELTAVVLESPFAGDVARNLRYARAAMRDCLCKYHEAPFASHCLYTQPGVLDDLLPEERRLGVLAGFSWRIHAKHTVVYTDLGITTGMAAGIRHAQSIKLPVYYRSLGPEWDVAAPEPKLDVEDENEDEAEV